MCGPLTNSFQSDANTIININTINTNKQRLDRSGMLYEERLEAAERRRLEGNALFRDGALEAALGKWAMVRRWRWC